MVHHKSYYNNVHQTLIHMLYYVINYETIVISVQFVWYLITVSYQLLRLFNTNQYEHLMHLYKVLQYTCTVYMITHTAAGKSNKSNTDTNINDAMGHQ